VKIPKKHHSQCKRDAPVSRQRRQKQRRRNRSVPFRYSRLLGCLSSTVELYPRAQAKVKRVFAATILMD